MPAQNRKDVKDLPQEVKDGLSIVHVRYVSPHRTLCFNRSPGSALFRSLTRWLSQPYLGGYSPHLAGGSLAGGPRAPRVPEPTVNRTHRLRGLTREPEAPIPRHVVSVDESPPSNQGSISAVYRACRFLLDRAFITSFRFRASTVGRISGAHVARYVRSRRNAAVASAFTNVTDIVPSRLNLRWDLGVIHRLTQGPQEESVSDGGDYGRPAGTNGVRWGGEGRGKGKGGAMRIRIQDLTD